MGDAGLRADRRRLCRCLPRLDGARRSLFVLGLAYWLETTLATSLRYRKIADKTEFEAGRGRGRPASRSARHREPALARAAGARRGLVLRDVPRRRLRRHAGSSSTFSSDELPAAERELAGRLAGLLARGSGVSSTRSAAAGASGRIAPAAQRSTAGSRRSRLAVASPVDAYSDRLFWAHMTQHVLLTMVAPPLLLLGPPVAADAQAVRDHRYGARSRGRCSSVRRSRRCGPAGRWIAAPLPAFVAFSVVLLGWHLPALYDLTLRERSRARSSSTCSSSRRRFSSGCTSSPARPRGPQLSDGQRVAYGNAAPARRLGAGGRARVRVHTRSTAPYSVARDAVPAGSRPSPTSRSRQGSCGCRRPCRSDRDLLRRLSLARSVDRASGAVP